MSFNLTFFITFVLCYSSFFLKFGFTSMVVGKRGIIGGLDAPERPFFVSLYTLAGVCCGGTVIAERHVLTAGHCIKCEYLIYCR